MNRIIISSCLLLLANQATAQTTELINLHFEQRKYEQVLQEARAVTTVDTLAAFANGITGSILVLQAKYDSAIPYL